MNYEDETHNFFLSTPGPTTDRVVRLVFPFRNLNKKSKSYDKSNFL